MPSKTPLKADVSRNALLNRLSALLDQAGQLPITTALIKAQVSVIHEMASLQGFLERTVVHDQAINVQFVTVPTKPIDPVPLEPKDPAQLPFDFDRLPPASYSLKELLQDEEDQEQSPPGSGSDPLPD